MSSGQSSTIGFSEETFGSLRAVHLCNSNSHTASFTAGPMGDGGKGCRPEADAGLNRAGDCAGSMYDSRLILRIESVEPTTVAVA